MIYVFGGNMRQAEDYIHVKGLKGEARVMFDGREIRGTRNPEVHLVGTYFSNPGWCREFRDELEIRGAKIVECEDWR